MICANRQRISVCAKTKINRIENIKKANDNAKCNKRILTSSHFSNAAYEVMKKEC